ncbi:hypothetical protein H0H87_002405 [Tephrocybe sp. NHM501043]|nr:hypothetical protein H0H87_002405 [Tephrocybe sp. NHM501043]
MFHAASVNEIPEDEAIIYSETPPENIEEQQDDVPVRVLDDFAVFDVSSNELVPIAQLYYQNSRTFSASGLVRAYVCDQGNEDEEDSEDDEKNSRIRLSTILKFDVHSISEETGDLDSKIYLQTKHAWYILSIPSQQYKPFYAPFWIQHRVLHALVNLVLRNPQATFEEFTESFSDVNGDESARENAIASVHVLGRVITEADIQSDDVKAYATALFPDICGQDYGLDIRRVNLATEYLDLDLDDYLAQKGKPRRQRKFSSDEEQEVLKHNTSTFVTPKVSQIMRNLFSVPLDVAEIPEIEDDTDIIAQIDNLVAHHEDPTSMKWGAKENGLYRSIIMDGVEYCVGDEVMVSPGTDENGKAAQVSKTDACQSPNTYANRLWFCKICYFFEKVVDGKKIKMFHHQWLTHGSKTILQETAHSKSLFLLDGCDDNPVAAIFKKCNVTWLKPEDKELPDDGAPNSNDFHCSLIYDEADAHFIDLPSDEEMSDLLQGEKPCLSCAMRKQREQLDDPVVFADGYLRHGISYHVHDFVYLRLGKETAGLLEIGQITKLGSPQALDEFKITVRLLSRYERQDCSELELLWDEALERRLYFTDRVHAIDYQQIEGKCYIQLLTKIEEIEKWVRHDNHYYVNQQLDARRGRLYGMEQGAGGLGTGLDLSGFVETKYAVEFSPSAAATYA